MHKAVALLYPNALATSISLPLEILHAASQYQRAQGRATEGSQQLLALSGPGAEAPELAGGLRLQAQRPLEQLARPDLLILPAIWRSPRPALRCTRHLHPLLRNWAEAGTLICSVGSGSCVLAEAGLLDQRPATTHWNHFDSFEKRYPRVQLKRRHLITQTATIYCAGSVNSIADLMVHIVERWYGPRCARAVEHQFSPEIRQAFHAAAFQEHGGSAHHDEPMLNLQLYLQEHLQQPHSLASLAARSGLSERSLSRRFRRATGTSVLQYLLHLRVQEARSLLLHTDISLGEIAWRCGWPSAAQFSQQFRAREGVSPSRYRRAVRGKRFSHTLRAPTA